jgi:enoyl-CoA hydratase/carnithine racemase
VSDLVVERDGPVLIVTIDRPRRGNSFTLDLLSRLWDTWDAFERDGDLRVAVLTGSGRIFCAGRDLDELRAADDGEGLVALRPASAPAEWLPRLLPATRKPTIAAINGAAVGGGWGLAQRCDLRLAGESATFSLPGIEHGVSVGNFLVELARLIPPAIAMELAQTGCSISAQRAFDIGFLNRVVPGDELRPAALSLAHELASRNQLPLRLNKELITRSVFHDHEGLWSLAQHALEPLRANAALRVAER